MFKTDKKDPEYVKYTKYIASKDFKKIKDLVFERDHYSCVACGWSLDEYDENKKSMKRTLQCHHKDYSILYDEINHLDCMSTLCSVCHRAIHAAPSNIHRFKKSLDNKLNDKQ